MASDQTTNFGLNQWAAGDSVLREEFNADNAKIDAALTNIFSRGMILMWNGAQEEIPSGWRLCDGEGGTPDLRGRFIVGAGGEYETGSTGGSAQETMQAYNETSGTIFGGFYAHQNEIHDNRPPYYALCYIMKV